MSVWVDLTAALVYSTVTACVFTINDIEANEGKGIPDS